jgi:hypothetical protein
MDDNELYISYTRSLNELIIIGWFNYFWKEKSL